MVTTFYGNGPIMAQVLTSVVYMMTSPDYTTLLQFMLVAAGACMIGIWHITNIRGGLGGHSLIMSMLTVILVYYGAWAPRTSIVVYDPLNNFQTAVNNMPEGLAILVYTSNKITNGFADLADQAFASSGFPDGMSYNNGMVPGLLTITALGDLSPQDSYLLESINSYYTDCLFPALLMGNDGPTVQTITQSSNLLQAINTNLSNAWDGTYYSSSYPQGESMACSANGGTPDLYDSIVNQINSDLNNPASGINQSFVNNMLMGFSGVAKYNNSVTDSNLLQSAGTYLTNAGVTSQQLLSQALLINSFAPAMNQFAAQTGTNANALNSAVTQGMLATTTSMTTSYALARQLLPMAFLIISALIYSIMPIVIAMMVIPQLTKKFGMMGFELLMWIAFWAPLAAVINFIVQATASQTFVTFGSSAFAMENWGYLMQHSKTLMAIAGDMMFSVPVLAFALASGSSYAMTSVAGSITGLSRGMAGTAANGMSTMSGSQGMQSQGMSENALGKGAGAEKESASAYTIQQSDMQAANTAGMTDVYRKVGFNASRQSTANSKAQQTGAGLGFQDMEQALGVGVLGTQSSVGKLTGAFHAYENAERDGFKGSFSSFVGGQSQYQNTNLSTQANAMQGLANEYFGGDLNKEVGFVNTMESKMKLGKDFGENQAYSMAKENGFKGNLTDFEAFQQKWHSAITYGQNVGTIQAADNVDGGNVLGFTEFNRKQSGVQSWVNGNVLQNLESGLGIGAIIKGDTNKKAEQIGGGIGLGSLQSAYGIGQILAGKQVGEANALGSEGEAERYASFNTREKMAEQAYLQNPQTAGMWAALSKYNPALGELAVMDGNIQSSEKGAGEFWGQALSDSKTNDTRMIRQKIAMNSANTIASMISKKWGNNAEVGANGEIYVAGKDVAKLGSPGLFKAVFGVSDEVTVEAGAKASIYGGYKDTAQFSVDQIKQMAYNRAMGIMNSNETSQQKTTQLDNFYGDSKKLRESSGNITNKAMSAIDKFKGQGDNLNITPPSHDKPTANVYTNAADSQPVNGIYTNQNSQAVRSIYNPSNSQPAGNIYNSYETEIHQHPKAKPEKEPKNEKNTIDGFQEPVLPNETNIETPDSKSSPVSPTNVDRK